MTKILVTGGAGFIGSHIVKKFLSLNYEVVVVDNLSSSSKDNIEGLLDRIIFLKADLSKESTIAKIVNTVKQSDFLFHLAALPRIGKAFNEPNLTHEANVTATLNVLRLAKLLNAKRMIFSSSSSIYGTQPRLPLSEDMEPNPLHPYANQKLMGELYCRVFSKVYNLPVTVLRLFNVYGPSMPSKGIDKLVFGHWIESIKKDLPLMIHGDGNQTRDFTYIDDVVEAFVKVTNNSEKLLHFDVFNICSSRQTTINKLARLFGYPVKYIAPRYNESFEERYKQGSFQKANRILDWQPKTPLEIGVPKFLESQSLKLNGLIVIPAFNEETTIKKVLTKIPKSISGQLLDLIVINDGSTDKTAELLSSTGIKFLTHPINRGLGAALATGFEYARLNNYDFLITLDADGQHDPAEISRLIKPILNFKADFIVGNRTSGRGKMPLVRKLWSFLASITTYILTGVWVNDSQSGFRVFSKRAIYEINIEVDRMEVSTDFFLQARERNLRVVELPIKSIYTKYSLRKGQSLFNSFNIIGKLALNRLVR
jgi:nucleoside-diphosphate-sugar epimerase